MTREISILPSLRSLVLPLRLFQLQIASKNTYVKTKFPLGISTHLLHPNLCHAAVVCTIRPHLIAQARNWAPHSRAPSARSRPARDEDEGRSSNRWVSSRLNTRGTNVHYLEDTNTERL